MEITQIEDAVSPVIGVILMVAVTVILAAVIAGFVFGVPANIQKAHVVAATGQLSQDGSKIILTYNGGQDAKQVQGLNWSIGGVAQPSLTPNGQGIIPIGASTTAAKGTGHVIVSAYYADSSSSVILDSNY